MAVGAMACAVSGSAESLYKPGNWSSLATDRRAFQVGDILTVLVYENATASNSASAGSKKNSKVGGAVNAGGKLDEAANLSLNGSSDSQGTTGRSGQMVAQISVKVDEVLPNGDLRLSGTQMLNLSGEHTTIRVKGRVRAADISAANAVLSSRLADAEIDYDGKGFVSRSAHPGIVTKIFNWLGLL
jgi:flagellar L-ring protein precursor FlgH